MKPLICPQCGGKITDYDQWQKFATCQYCSTRFLIEQEKQPQLPPPVHFEPSYNSSEKLDNGQNLVFGIVAVVGLIFGAVIFLSVVITKSRPTPPTYPVYSTTTPPKIASPTPTPNLNLLEFGGKGTGNGLFQDADAIAVDKQGKIYVADDSLRVQQFNEKGEFLKVWQIPSQTIHYKRARTIQKIAVDDKNRLYVLVGGTILVYEQDASEPSNTFHAAPDFMVDFALRSDGTMLIVSSNDEIETLIFVNKAGKVTRRINGFHTETADAVLSPRETGLAAIRLGVDGAGNIYSVYAFGDLGSYELNYDSEDLMIFRFSPEAKYVNKFVQTMNSCGIEIDNQSRIYISDENSINIYTNNGELVSNVPDLGAIDAFALDTQNNIYVLADDKVIKRPAVK
jgi:sugar lactone lactonase YvrE/DNA-directed RNA polymerase subunit RPC12/RpoP